MQDDVQYARELREQYARDKADRDELYESFKATEALLKANAPIGADFDDAVAYYMGLAELINELGARINENVALYNEIVSA